MVSVHYRSPRAYEAVVLNKDLFEAAKSLWTEMEDEENDEGAKEYIRGVVQLVTEVTGLWEELVYELLWPRPGLGEKENV